MKKVLLFCLVVTLVCCAVVPVFAKEDAKTNGYNVVIAMDSSRSLEYTDPNNYRYNAVNLFIQLLANKQNKLGCLSFSGDVSNQQHLTDINKSSDKQSVYNALTSTEVTGWTNIGSALQEAVKDIQANGDKNQQSVILLFSDGNTEMPTDKAQRASLDAKADAVQTARDNNIAIYSICLNADGKADKKEMEQVSNATGGKFVEIQKAEDLQDALTAFYTMIYGTSVQTIVDSTFDSKGSIEVPFDVPGTGVGEINIIIYGKAKDVVITRPDNSVAKCDVIEADTYSFLKVSDIILGRWTVSLSGVTGDKVKVDLLFNTDVNVLTSIKPNQDSFNPDDKITFEAILNSESKPVEFDKYADGFTATLLMRDKYGETVKEIPMTVKDGSFVVETQLEEGTYKYSVLVKGYNLIKESEITGPITVSDKTESQAKLNNLPPVPKNNPVNIKINLWPFKENIYTMDVTDLAKDDQEEPLEYRIESSSFIEGEDFNFDGKTLVMKDYSLSKGEILFNAFDKYGESCQITVRISTRNIGLMTIIIFAVIALVVAALIILFAFRNKILFFNGTVTVTSQQTWQTFTQEHPGKGQYKLSRFAGLDNIGLNYNKSYFQAKGGKYAVLCTDKAITIGGSKTTKKLRLDSGRQYIVSLPIQDGMVQPAIIVQFDSKKRKSR